MSLCVLMCIVAVIILFTVISIIIYRM